MMVKLTRVSEYPSKDVSGETFFSYNGTTLKDGKKVLVSFSDDTQISDHLGDEIRAPRKYRFKLVQLVRVMDDGGEPLVGDLTGMDVYKLVEDDDAIEEITDRLEDAGKSDEEIDAAISIEPRCMNPHKAAKPIHDETNSSTRD